MEAFFHPTLNAEAAEGNFVVATRNWIAFRHNMAVGVNPSMLRLEHVEVVCRADLEADIALKVSRLVVVALFARAMLGEVFGCAHHKLGLVRLIGHALRINGTVEMTVHRGKVNERLVVHARVDHALNILWEPLDARSHGGGGSVRPLSAMIR